ncbi:DUF4190 domain-containing protein [Gordonia sp. NPDC058843]|uniref:DUF4190 domain-containing protein n=1 Tax=Gordonia sp. NPDC058843 TaxID=3346648 RepID=UPI00368FE638
MSYPPGQGSGQGQDDWGTVPGSGSSGGSGPNLSKGDQGRGGAAPEYAPTEYGQTYQPGPSSDPYGQNAYGQNAYGQNPYGQNPYGQNPSGQNAYGQDQYGQSPYGSPAGDQGYGAPGQDPYAQPPGGSYGQYNDPYQAGQAPAYGSAYGSQNPYGASPYGGGYGYGAPQKSTNGKAIAALICGIVGVVSLIACLFFSFFLSIPVGIAAVVLGFMARRDIEQSGGTQSGSGMGLAGIITGSLAIVGGVVWTVLFIVLIVVGDTSSSTYYY